jgi:hypothetical protein
MLYFDSWRVLVTKSSLVKRATIGRAIQLRGEQTASTEKYRPR